MTQISPARETTPLDELHRLLYEAENRIGALERGSAGDTLKLLHMLDDIERIYNDLSAADVDLRAEDSRRETIQMTVHRKAGVVLRLLGPEGGIAGVRARQKPPQANWWWQLDDYAAEQRRKAVRGFMISAAIVAGILLVATILYKTVFAPDPLVIAHMNRLNDVQVALEANDQAGALQAADAGLVEFPGDGEFLLWRGTILGLMTRQQEAQAAYDAARPAYADDVTYLVSRSNVRLQAHDLSGAYADAKAAVAITPDSAQAYLALGAAQEMRGEVNAASGSYSTAAGLAAAQKNSQLEAMAKVRMAMMMQNAPIFPNPVTSEPTPTR